MGSTAFQANSGGRPRADAVRIVAMGALRAMILVSGCSLWAASCVPRENKPYAYPLSASGARLEATRGFEALLREGNALKAQASFEKALTDDTAEPYALFGRYLLARRAENRQEALNRALEVCEKAPNHPLSTAAARAVLEATGLSGPADEETLRRLPPAIEKTTLPDTAHLLRTALAALLYQRQTFGEYSATLVAMGVPETWSVLGPLSPFSVLSFDEAFEMEKTGHIPEEYASLVGKVRRRTLRFADGRFHLSGEPSEGDGYVAAVDLSIRQAGPYVLRVVSQASYRLWLDGTQVLSRRAFESTSSQVNIQGVALRPGTHRLLIRVSKDDSAAPLTFSMTQPDGRPADVSFAPAKGPASSWAGVELTEWKSFYPSSTDLQKALALEVGNHVATFIAVRDGMGRDRDGARKLLLSQKSLPEGPAWATLWAELNLFDKTIPMAWARGRAASQLESVLDKDALDRRAVFLSASLALDEGRFSNAMEILKKAQASGPELTESLLLLKARIEIAQRLEALAKKSALEVLAKHPGHCGALSLLFDLARQKDEFPEADAWLEASKNCPQARRLQAEHLRMRGNTDEALARYEALWAEDPTSVTLGSLLVDAYSTQRRYSDAHRVLETLLTFWPRQPALWLKTSTLFDLENKREKALWARQQAVNLDGRDITSRRILARARTGKELLEEFAISSEEAISAYEASEKKEDASSVYVLDAATVEVFEDGSMVDRIHTLQKALDQNGVSNIAEVQVPSGAVVLHLRTIKADGTVLEPETILEKESISLPNVQVGDYVDVEYLLAHAPRGPIQPGATAASFYFQILGQANAWSTYRVVAPASLNLRVDAHNMTAPAVSRLPDGRQVFQYELKHLPPFIPEPEVPPSANEYLPFVTVGFGTTGNEALVSAYADAFLSRGLKTAEVEKFAREAAAGAAGREAVQRVYEAVMGRVVGKDGGLSASASATLAQGRGSRLWLLKASLEALGIQARIAAVRTFNGDPAHYLFPNEALLPYVCLYVPLPSGEKLWLDTQTRWAPFGRLPEYASGGREAYLFPEPSRTISRVRTPRDARPAGKAVTLQLSIDVEGNLKGRGQEVLRGFDAALLGEAFENMADQQRFQAFQGALGRSFRGAELTSLSVEKAAGSGTDLKVKYEFQAPQFAQVNEGRLILSAVTFPVFLGRRYAQLSSRKTPLYIESTERIETRVTLTLPQGHKPSEVLERMQSASPFGQYVRQEKASGNVLQVEEEFELEMARIPPSQYRAFSQFAAEVDFMQAREMTVIPKATGR